MAPPLSLGYPFLDRVSYPYAGSLAINIDDLVFLISNTLVPGSSLTATSSPTADQKSFARYFAGTAKERCLTSDAAGSREVNPNRVTTMNCVSAAYTVGQLVTLYSSGSGPYVISSNTVTQTSDGSVAIGYSVQDTGGNSVTSIEVQLISRTTPGSLPGTGLSGFDGLTLNDGGNIVVGTSTGTQIGTATTQKLGFYNATPIVQRSGSAEAAVATTGSTTTTPYGYTTSAQADGIVTLLNEIRATLVALGLFKGSA